jgi:hypothetical protein
VFILLALPVGGAPWKRISREIPRLGFVALPRKRAAEAPGGSGAAAQEESEAECEARVCPKNIREYSILSSSYQVFFSGCIVVFERGDSNSNR